MSAPLSHFGTHDGELAVGGVPVSLLASRVGSTPFFAYDRDLITRRVGELRAAMPSSLRLSYAMKANPFPAVVQHLAGLVDKIDVASVGEMGVALDTVIAPQSVSFAGPGKTPDEVRRAVAAGIQIELESETEAERVASAGEELGVRPRVAIRVNPDFAVKGSGMRMGGGPQQFGIDSEEVPALVRRLQDRDLDLLGFHVFAGSQNLSASVIAEAQERTVELALRLAEHLPEPLRYLNIGGGFGIPYSDRDTPLDLGAVGSSLAELLRTTGPRMPEAEIVLELGRYIVGESGVYVTRVIDVKRSRGRLYAVVDGGMHHQLAASGNFGQVIRRNYPIALANRLGDSGADEPVTVVGCLCTPLDLLGADVDLPAPHIGDLVAIMQAGAYGATASPSAFLSHPPAAEVLVTGRTP